jgi:hypothetical protein
VQEKLHRGKCFLKQKKIVDLLCFRALDSSALPAALFLFFLNNTYIINLTGCAYLILLCSKYYKTKQKICHEDKPKSAIDKKNEKKEKKSSNRMLDQMCLKKLKKRLYFERSIFALSPLPTHTPQKLRNFAPNNVFFLV